VVLSVLFAATPALYLLVRPVAVPIQGNQGGSASQPATTAPKTTSTTQTTTSSVAKKTFGLRDGELDRASDEIDRSDDELDYPGITAGRDGDRHGVTVPIRLRG
jgi:hypothetical protein